MASVVKVAILVFSSYRFSTCYFVTTRIKIFIVVIIVVAVVKFSLLLLYSYCTIQLKSYL